jgi:AAA family ATP:ADP antiporter
VVCNPLGKSGGALIQQFMILSFGSLANSTPYLGGILLVIVLAWLGAVRSLDSQFSPLAKQELEREKLLKAKAVETTATVVGAGNGSLQENLASETSANGSAIKQSQEPDGSAIKQSQEQDGSAIKQSQEQDGSAIKQSQEPDGSAIKQSQEPDGSAIRQSQEPESSAPEKSGQQSQ